MGSGEGHAETWAEERYYYRLKSPLSGVVPQQKDLCGEPATGQQGPAATALLLQPLLILAVSNLP